MIMEFVPSGSLKDLLEKEKDKLTLNDKFDM